MIRVLHVVDSLRVGGTEGQLVEVVCRADPARQRVTLACLRAEGDLLPRVRAAGVPVAEFSPRGTLLSFRGLGQLLRLARFIRRERFHVVHAHDLYSNLLAVPAAWLARAPVILSSRRNLAHLAWYTPRRKWVARVIYRLSTAVVANAQAIRQHLVRTDGIPPEKIRVILNAVDFTRFAAGGPARESLFPGASGEDRLVAVVGNMHSKVKGHGNLIEAARTVCREFSAAQFVLIGDGPLRAEYEQCVRDYALEKRVFFLGRRMDVAGLLGGCNLFVLPSSAEGFPNVVLEAQAAGLPVVATAVGGVPEVVESGVTGLLVPPHDPQALAAAMLRLLCDPELAQRLARAGRERVQTRFGFDRLLRELEELYAELLSRRGINLPAPRGGAAFTSPAP